MRQRQQIPSAMSRAGAPRRVLGIDLGMSTGWAVLDADEVGSIVVIGGGARKWRRSPGEPGKLDHEWAAWIAELLEDHRPIAVSVEDVRRHAGTAAAHVYGGLRSQLQRTAYENGVAVLPIGVGTAKKRLAGSGRASKAVMVAHASKSFGLRPVNHDHADALAVALCGLDEAAAWREVRRAA